MVDIVVSKEAFYGDLVCRAFDAQDQVRPVAADAQIAGRDASFELECIYRSGLISL